MPADEDKSRRPLPSPMSYPVTYYCPHCGTLVELEREGYLSDKAVTPYPFEGWEYVAPDEEFEDGAADGVAFVCGESPPQDGGLATDDRVVRTPRGAGNGSTSRS
ncbi:hypothetical protein GCM10009000_088670 [Halobacterium noricense]